METYDIPRTFSLDDTLYGISMYVANICMTFLLLLLFDIKNAFGLVYMVPAFVAHVLAKMDPDRFYYIWDGWFNVLKILGSILYIYSFLVIFELNTNQTMNTYYFIVLVVLYLYLIPSLVVPHTIELLNSVWSASSSVLHINQKPNYILEHLVFPSGIISVCLMLFGQAAKNIIYTVK